jgi:hypothetical protein
MREDVRRASHCADLSASIDIHKRAQCNDCNEVVRLAAVAKNALMNGDFPRVIAVLDVVARLSVRSDDSGEVERRRRLEGTGGDVASRSRLLCHQFQKGGEAPDEHSPRESS